MESNNETYWVVTWPSGRHELQSFNHAMRTAERLAKTHEWVAVTFGPIPDSAKRGL